MSSKESLKLKLGKKKVKEDGRGVKKIRRTSPRKKEKEEAGKSAHSLELRREEKKIKTAGLGRSEGVESKPSRYWEAVGRRKRAIARVRLFTRGEKEAVVNGKAAADYFPTVELQDVAFSALRKMKSIERFRVVAHVVGGGIHGQAEAVRHATSRALIKFNPDFRIRLRKAGYLTRDPREKERRKYGLKKARRAPQWQKR